MEIVLRAIQILSISSFVLLTISGIAAALLMSEEQIEAMLHEASD